MRAVLQKLLNANLAKAIVEQGYDQVGGIVVEAADTTRLRTAGEIAAAYGFQGSPDFVDVVRFELPACARLSQPADKAERPWPTYPLGFLPSAQVVPVWELTRARYSPGAEYWRINQDGRQERLSVYVGAARGWQGARGWRPPSRLVGTRATWQGSEYCADVTAETVQLTWLGEQADPAWDRVRPGAHTRTVPRAECEIFEYLHTATLDGVPVRVLATDGRTAHVLVTDPDPAAAQRIAAAMVEPGVFELSQVPVTTLADHRLVANQLIAGSGRQ